VSLVKDPFMNDQKKTKKQLIDELTALRQKVAETDSLEKDTSGTPDESRIPTAFYKHILETIDEGILVMDKNDRIFFVNDPMSGIAGVPKKQILGALVMKDFSEDTLKYFRSYYFQARESLRTVSFDSIAVVTPAGRMTYQSGILVPLVKDGHFDGMICTIRDRTDRKKTEEMVQKQIIALTQPLEGGTVAFEDLFDIREIQRLQDDFATATGVAALITRPDGTPITKPSNFTYLCSEFIRKTEKGRWKCQKSDATIGRRNIKGPIVQTCLSAGLWNAGASIMIGGRHIANWLIGQVRDETQKEETLQAYAREIGTDEKGFIEAFQEVPVMSKKKFGQVARALFTLANQISLIAYQNVQQARFISERQKAEDALILTQFAMDQAPDSILLVGEEGNITYANDAACTSLGYTREELLRMTAFDIDPDFPVTGWEQHKQDLKRTGRMTFEGRHRTKDGRLFPVEVTTNYFDYSGRFIGVAFDRDITSRRSMEEKLKLSEKKYRDIFESVPIGIYQSTPKGRFIEANHYMATVLGYDSPADLMESVTSIGKQIYVIPADRKKAARLFKEQGYIQDFEAQLVKKNGDLIWGSLSAKTIRDAEGNTLYYEGVFQDITERKQAENALKENENKFRAIFDASNDAIVLLNKKYFIDCNNRALEMYGIKDKEEFLKHSPADTSPPFQPDGQDSSAAAQNKIQTAFEQGHNHFEWMHRRADGEEFPAEVLLSSFIYKDEVVLQATIRDISFRKKVEEERAKASKLEAVGTLAGGIAHDFNNLLTTIQGYIELIKLDVPPENEIHKKLKAVEKSVISATELTGRLITFSKGGDPIKEITDIGNLIKDAVLRNAGERQIEKKLQIDDNLWPVKVDGRQMRQAISNLIINAVEAMPEGGILTVRAENTTVTAQDNLPLVTGNYIKISVEDTGAGIPAIVLPFIFDIYFSTKQRGAQKGMGLGLSVSHSIVSKHEGCILAKSNEGKGSTFHVYLPAVVTFGSLSPEKKTGGKGRILVMDDDAVVRQMLTELLTALQYDVETTDNGWAAVEMYIKAMESRKPYGVVMLALKIAGSLGGKQTMQTLQVINPAVKGIIISGYTDDPVIQNYSQYGFKGALKKPFTLNNLRDTLDACL